MKRETSEPTRYAAFQAIYIQIGKWYKQRQQRWLFPVEGDGRSGRKVKSMLQTARNMMIVILFCWVPGTRKLFFFFFKGNENAGQSHFELLSNGCFVLLPTAVILLVLLSQITSHNLFALYVIQVSYCWILQNNIR